MSTVNLDRYVADIRKFDTLSKEDEIALFAEYKNGNEKAKDAIIAPNLRWALKRAQSMTSDPDKMQDLVQEGSMGMLEAFNRYDPARGCKFFTFATYYIDLYMRICAFGYKNVVRQTNDKRIGMLVRKIQNEFFNLNQRYPIEYEIVDILENVHHIKVKDMSDIYTMGFSYIDNYVATNNDGHRFDDDSQTIGECGEFASKTASINDYEKEIESEGKAEEIKKYLRALTAKEKDIVVKAFGLNGGMAMEDEDIAEGMGITAERVRQIRVGAIRKMKNVA